MNIERGMRKNRKGMCLIAMLIVMSILFLSSVYGFEINVLLENQANIHSDGECGRSNHGWLDDCNTASFTGSGPGGCKSSSKADGVGGCYFWQPSGSPKVAADSKVNLPSAMSGKLEVFTGHYGGGTFLNERVNVFVNGIKVGTTDDFWCNDNPSCEDIGPHEKTFKNIFFNAGTNIIKFEAVNNGGSVYIQKYKIVAQPTECNPGETQSQGCGNCGAQTRTCLSNGTWGNFGTCSSQGPCSPGEIQAQSCSTGLPGICEAGDQNRTCLSTCQWGSYGNCQQDVQPSTEICNDLDDDCNGAEDEVCATCISNTIPFSMAPGQILQANVTVRNDGSVPWTRNANYKLGSQNPQDNLVWSLGRVLINSGISVNESQQYTFSFPITAPSVPGTYHNEWRMLKEFEFWFLPPNCGHDIIIQGECNPGEMQSQGCGNCGAQTRTCLSNGTWGNFGTCTNQGPCSPGDIQAQSCSTGLPGICSPGSQTRTCQSSCQWNNFGTCQQNNQPGQETCNSIDDDCDGQIDEYITQQCGSGACNGFRTCVNGQFNDCSSEENLCDSLNCDPLDTACRDYHDVNAYCNDDGICMDENMNCDDFTNALHHTPCGNGFNEFGCPWGNDLDDDTGIREHDFHCDGIGTCMEMINPWQVDEVCSSNEFCFWDGMGSSDQNYFCKQFCPDQDSDGFTTCDGDCNDLNPNVYPGAIEVCNSIDDDCDGQIDEGLICECSPGQIDIRSCGVTDVGICELGTQTRTCQSNSQWGNFGTCNGEINPMIELCNGLDDDCDGFTDENNVCISCDTKSISIRGDGGNIESIGNFTNINEETSRFSAWFKKEGDNGEGILSLELQGNVDGQSIKLRVKGKVREVFENNCDMLYVDNSYWSLATYQKPGNAPISITFDSIVYRWDRINGLLDIHGLGPFVNFNVTGIRIVMR